MKTEVKCALPETTVAAAAACMRDEHVGFLPICDESRNVVGTITDRDITIRVVAENESLNKPVNQFMTREVVACLCDDDVAVAQDLMGEAQVSRILCMSENGALEGVISLSDIAQACDGFDASDTLRNVSAREARM